MQPPDQARSLVLRQHGPKVPGDEQIRAAFIGPDTPGGGELFNRPVRYQQDIAPTILELLGIDAGAYSGMPGVVIPEAIALVG